VEALDDHCAQKLKVLADPTRLTVLEVLRAAGMGQSSRDRKAVLYSLAPGVAAGRERRGIDLGCCELSFKEAG
jgi:hypothetical protein